MRFQGVSRLGTNFNESVVCPYEQPADAMLHDRGQEDTKRAAEECDPVIRATIFTPKGGD